MTNSLISPPTTNLECQTIPGSLVAIDGIGALLQGDSNSGKSELALSLIANNHQLISDDAIECFVENGSLYGRAPALLTDLIEIRDLGIINVRDIFGEQATVAQHKIHIIIVLSSKARPHTTERLQPKPAVENVLGIALPVFTLFESPARNREILVETLVKTWIMTQSGFDAGQKLVENHTQTLEANQT